MNNSLRSLALTIVNDQEKEIKRLRKEVERHKKFGEEMIAIWVDTSNRSSLKKLAEIQDKAEQHANLMYP